MRGAKCFHERAGGNAGRSPSVRASASWVVARIHIRSPCATSIEDPNRTFDMGDFLSRTKTAHSRGSQGDAAAVISINLLSGYARSRKVARSAHTERVICTHASCAGDYS